MGSKGAEKNIDLKAKLRASTSPFGKTEYASLNSLEKKDYSESEITMNIMNDIQNLIRLLLLEREEMIGFLSL